MPELCTYCDSDIHRHDPVFVTDGRAEGRSAEGGNTEGGSAEGGSAEGGSAKGESAEGGSAKGESAAGQFCNYACLAAYIEEEGLTEGAACEWP